MQLTEMGHVRARQSGPKRLIDPFVTKGALLTTLLLVCKLAHMRGDRREVVNVPSSETTQGSYLILWKKGEWCRVLEAGKSRPVLL